MFQMLSLPDLRTSGCAILINILYFSYYNFALAHKSFRHHDERSQWCERNCGGNKWIKEQSVWG